MTNITHNLRGLADKLGSIRAQKADLIVQEKTIRDIIVESGEKIIEDSLFRANRVEQNSTSIDWKAIALKMDPSRQLIRAHTSRSMSVQIRMTARTGTGLDG